MQENLFKWFYHIRQYRFVDLTQQTLTRIFPFAILGSFFSALRKTVLDDEGFVNNIFDVPKWLPHYGAMNQYLENLTHLTLGILGILAAYYMAELTVEKYSHRIYQAGITAAIAYILIFNSHSLIQGHVQLSVLTRYTGMKGLLIGLIFGFFVGTIFGWIVRYSERHKHHATSVNNYGLIGVVFLILAGALGLSVGINLLSKSPLLNDFIEGISNVTHSGSLAMTIFGSFLTSALRWIGLSGPFEFDSGYTSTAANANLMYALRHHSAWHVPNPFTEESLYDGFGLFGGVGGILALIVAISLVSHNRQRRSIMHVSLIPSIFGSAQGMMIGLPVLFNPVYLIPFVMVPVLNAMLAAGCIVLRIMPPSIYPVPIGTPGPLIAFVGSGGNFIAPIVGTLMFIMDVFIYIPFVKLDNQVLKRLNDEKKEGVKNVKN